MKKRTKKILIGIAIALVLIAIAAFIFMNKANADLEQLSNMKIENVNLGDIADGDYEGEYKVFPVSVEVKVSVANHKISNIVIEKHFNGQGKPAEAIVDQVIATQTLQVDAITGATYSSKVILKAIENALIKERE
jgi:uncharacterized protein with FMN-binding domain